MTMVVPDRRGPMRALAQLAGLAVVVGVLLGLAVAMGLSAVLDVAEPLWTLVEHRLT